MDSAVDREPGDDAPEVPLAAETLDEALKRMTWTVEEGAFALAGWAGPPVPEDLAALVPPAQLVRESDETTLLMREEELAGVLARHPAARVERDLSWIRFDAPMGWEVVGFLARVTTALAGAGVPLGCVCGFGRDHLFVARRYLARTRETLTGLFPASS
jgi:hypothetical protein